DAAQPGAADENHRCRLRGEDAAVAAGDAVRAVHERTGKRSKADASQAAGAPKREIDPSVGSAGRLQPRCHDRQQDRMRGFELACCVGAQFGRLAHWPTSGQATPLGPNMNCRWNLSTSQTNGTIIPSFQPAALLSAVLPREGGLA